MFTLKVKYLGSTTSGRSHKYEIVESTVAKAEALAAKATTECGLGLNTNIGTHHFLSPTHIHICPKIGDIGEVTVNAFVDNNSRTVNFFANVDKAVQKRFITQLRVNEEMAEFGAIQQAADNNNIAIGSYALLKEMQAKVALLTKQAQAIVIQPEV